ncbi:MAG: hypothetical protein AAF685_12985 [Cyanobacteria bacterium P01_C01_bin.89]
MPSPTSEAIALPLSKEHQDALKQFSFTPHSPGTLLADFQLLLDEAEANGIPITPRTGEPNLKFCATLNPRLQTSTAFTLKRPGQSHYCHLRSLFWLARVGGLVTMEGSKRVVANGAQMEAWSALNPAEQYFSLMDLCLFYANPRLIGGYTLEGNAIDVQRWWTRNTPEETVIIQKFDELQICFGVHHLALLESFGFVTITLKSPQPYGPWPVERIEATPWGSAIMALLSQILEGANSEFPDAFTALPKSLAEGKLSEKEEDFGELDAMRTILQHMPGGPGEQALEQSPEEIVMQLMMNMQGQSEEFVEEWQNNLIQAGLMGEDFAEREAISHALGLNYVPASMEEKLVLEEPESAADEPPESFNLIQPLLQTWFPTYQKALPVPQLSSDTINPGLFTLKVSLGKKCWRIVTLLGSETLETLAAVILFAFDFDNDHLHEFTLRTVHGKVTIGHPAVARGDRHTGNTALGELELTQGSQLEFLFDFGDCWEFDVVVHDILTPPPPTADPEITMAFGEAPPQYPDWDDE